MLQPNISEPNAFIRMICGISMTAFGIGRISRKPTCTIGRLMIIGGAMKVAEGYFQYCPVTEMVKEDYSDSDSNTFS